MEIADIKKLGALARIELSDKEAAALLSDTEKILEFVGQIQSTSAELDARAAEAGIPRNVFREDGEPHEPGAYTEALLAEAPSVERGYVKVKRILQK